MPKRGYWPGWNYGNEIVTYYLAVVGTGASAPNVAADSGIVASSPPNIRMPPSPQMA